jgi:hypothetical protein
MADLRKKIISVLSKRFAAPVDALEEVKPTGRITGVLISASFKGLDHDVRQKRLTKILEEELTKDELAKVGPIALLTPAEAKVGAA